MTALLLATGCSKPETPATTAPDNASKHPAPVASEKPQAVETPMAADAQPATRAQQAPAAPANPTAATAAPVIASQPVATPAATVPSAAQVPQLALAHTATNQVQAQAAAMTNPVLAALAATNQVAATGTNQVAVLLERAKTLTADQKYQEALNTLTQLYNTKLTPEQKQQADALKEQIQTAMAQKATSGAASALGNVLGGKKQ